ncbi:MAG: 50S ribosomal protein L24e [Natronomonas sp.]
MVQKRTCDYSGQEIEPGTGTMFVKNDGTVLHFADAKCEKNYLMGREPRDLEWTETAREGRDRGDEQAEEAEADEAEAEAPDDEETVTDDDQEADEAADAVDEETETAEEPDAEAVDEEETEA